MPGSSLLYGSPVSSVTGSASISARNATHLPDPLPPWISPMTAVGTGDWILVHTKLRELFPDQL